MRKVILSVLGLLVIVGAYFASQAIIAANQRERPKPKKVVKTVFIDTVRNGTVPIKILTNVKLTH